MDKLRMLVSCGDHTTSQMRELLAEVDDAILDDLDVEWEPPRSPCLAGEPISGAVLLAGSALVITALLRLLERRMEHLQQRAMMTIVAEGFDKHPDLSGKLQEMAKQYTQVSVSYGLAKATWRPQIG